MKELDEAREKIAKATYYQYRYSDDPEWRNVGLWRREKHLSFADQILNLKGDGWKIAIVREPSYIPMPNYKEVICEAGDE